MPPSPMACGRLRESIRIRPGSTKSAGNKTADRERFLVSADRPRELPARDRKSFGKGKLPPPVQNYRGGKATGCTSNPGSFPSTVL